MSANFHPLPSTFPSAEALYLLGYLRNQAWNTGETLHAAWSLIGYAQVQLLTPLPAGTVLEPAKHPAPIANPSFSLEETLGIIAKPPKLPDGVGASALGIDWKSLILSLVSEVIKKLLG